MLKVDTVCMETQALQMRMIARQLNDISSRVASVNQKLRWNTNISATVRSSLASYSNTISTLDDKASRLAGTLTNAAVQYTRAEDSASSCAGGNTFPADALPGAMDVIDWCRKPHPGTKLPGLTDAFWDELRSNYGWKEALSGSGYIGKIYNLINDIRKGKTWRDWTKSGIDVYQFLSGAAKTYNNYKKIGNVVGTKTAMAWWAKRITGLKPLGRASTAKNPFTRFANNLTNKTSPFHAQFQNVIDNFKGANGAGKAVAAWGAVAVNGVMNWFGNKEEQANSNGTMSDGRVWAETITETAVDTALTYGAGIVVGAAVTTVLGTAAAPGVLVVAVSGLAVAGVNAGVKALTGKTTTEWVSDTILDTGEAIGNAAKNAVKSVGSWFKKLSFA